MSIIRLAWILYVAATVVGVTEPTARTPDVPNRPNILVILLDDAGYADFGFMGSPDLETPAIDRLAASGVVFSDAHISGTTCSPSRAGLITGRYQQRFGYECNVPPTGKGLDPEEHTLGDALRSAGYRTGYVGKWHLGSTAVFYPTRRGFDDFYGLREGSRAYFYRPEADDKPGSHRALEHNGSPAPFDGYLTDAFTEAALRFLGETSEQPFFLFLSYTAVHTPMHAKEEHLQKYQGHPRQKLAAMTWSVDEGIGRVLHQLDETGRRDDTLVFFLSDNGGAANNQSSNAPLAGWKGNKFEGGHRTAFIASWPRVIPAGESADGLTSSLDIFATAIAVAGLSDTTGKPLDGVNLMPYLLGARSDPPHQTLFWRKDAATAMRDGDYKLVHLEGFGTRLYDLSDDLAETRDLHAAEPERTAAMREALDRWKTGHADALWREGKDWTEVTYEIHRALMDQREPHYTHPGAMRAYRSHTGAD